MKLENIIPCWGKVSFSVKFITLDPDGDLMGHETEPYFDEELGYWRSKPDGMHMIGDISPLLDVKKDYPRGFVWER